MPQGKALLALSLQGGGDLPMCFLYIHPEKKPDNCYPPHTHIENCLISYCCLTIYPKMLRPKISTILLYRMITDSVIQTGFS